MNKRMFAGIMFLLLLLAGCTDRREAIDFADTLIGFHSKGIPANFSKDIPVYPGMKGVVATRLSGVNNYHLDASSDDNFEKVIAFYREQLGKTGWTQAGLVTSSAGMITMIFNKETHCLHFRIGAREWKHTDVSITQYEVDQMATMENKELGDPEARAILDRMEKVYADCKSYRDRGVVRTTNFEENGRQIEENPFATAFVRPDHFRFEVQSRFLSSRRWFQNIIHSDSSGTQSWQEYRIGVSPKKENSLETAIVSFTGISKGAALTIPALLLNLNEVCTGKLADNLRQLVLQPEADLNGTACYRLNGKNWQEDTLSLWISKESLLLLRIDRSQVLGPFRTEETTVYEAEINAAIPAKELAFNLPSPITVAVKEGIDQVELLFRHRNYSGILLLGSILCLSIAGCAVILRRILRRREG